MSILPRLIERSLTPSVANSQTMASDLEALDAEQLIEEYVEVVEWAPRRGADGFAYFPERSGRPPQSADERRREERLAMALVNDKEIISLPGESVELLTYAFPLFTTGGPKRIRAVDLVGHSRKVNRFWVIELKIAARKGYGQTPARAFYESLIYAAVVEANMADIASELNNMGHAIELPKPGLLIAAPDDYWLKWTPNTRIGDWWTPYRNITTALQERLHTPVAPVALGPVSFEIDTHGRPRATGQLASHPVSYSFDI